MDADLRNMVLAFRVTELQNLLGHFGKNRNGRKNELLTRALHLAQVGGDGAIAAKIRELYRSIQLSLTQPLPATASAVVAHTHAHGHNNSQSKYTTSQMSGRILYVPSTMNNGAGNMYHNRVSYATATAATNYNGSAQMSGLQVVSSNRIPICPDVRMKRLPFYDVQSELQRPTSLLSNTNGRAQESQFSFCLSPDQAGQISSSKEYLTNIGVNESRIQFAVQVQMRFCALDTSCLQDDLFPPNITIKVNQRNVVLPQPIPSNRPGVEAKRPSRPLNITNYVKISPTVINRVSVNWANDMSGRDYVIYISLVKKVGSLDLLNRLKAKGPRPSDYTKGMIKELVRKDDADCIATTSFKVSIACPLGKCRMSLPCRAATCNHLQCFDANLYLQMNEKKPVWSCPVCDKYTDFNDLAIDGYFNEVIAKLIKIGHEGNDIEVLPDGSWRALQINKKEQDEPPAKRMKSSARASETICLDDDDVCVVVNDKFTSAVSTAPTASSQTQKPIPPESEEVIDLTLSSDEDEDAPNKRTEDNNNTTKNNNTSTSSEENSKSGEEESEEEKVIRRKVKRKKPIFLKDETSSCSSSDDNSEVTAILVAANLTKPRSPSPDCIILDSPTPSPEPYTQKQTSKTNFGSACTTKFTNSSTSYSSQRDAPLGGFHSPHSFGGSALPHPVVIPPPTGTDMPFSISAANPFMSFDRSAAWDSTLFQSNSDFSSLDFPSMDYFNQASSFGGASRSGSDNGFGLSRW